MSVYIQWWWEAKNRNFYGNNSWWDHRLNIIYIFIFKVCTHTYAKRPNVWNDIDNEIQLTIIEKLTNDDLCDRRNHVNLMTTLIILKYIPS